MFVTKHTGSQSCVYAGPMSSETPQNRTLHRALKNYGGAPALAKALKVTVEELSPWLTGREGPSVKIYMATLKLIADARPKTR
jgi:hypothetical protein